tara:strand:- start:58 stop:1215 length:1158 start_codon:yes stop_codon:yes gene_type:complete
MKNIFYWSPFTSKVATVYSVINSAQIVNTNSKKNGFKATIVDAVREWDEFKETIESKNIGLINLNNNSKFSSMKREGFFRSRLAYWYIFFKCFNPLRKLLKLQKPSYLIIHLITPLPLLLFRIFNFDTKLILRISGLPKMTLLRKLIWKVAVNRIYKISCPTRATYENLSRYKFLREKLIILRDPVLNISEINFKKSKDYDIPEITKEFINNGKFYLSIGRFTKQKNFLFFLDCIIELIKSDSKLKFLLVGDGEEKSFFLEQVNKNNLSKNIHVLNYTTNVHRLMSSSEAFILTSLWEDPGWVIIEAAFNNCLVISSNCPNGPKEIIGNDGGYLFNSNSKESFIKVFNNFKKDDAELKFKKKIIVKKRVKEFTCFNHFLNLKTIL